MEPCEKSSLPSPAGDSAFPAFQITLEDREWYLAVARVVVLFTDNTTRWKAVHGFVIRGLLQKQAEKRLECLQDLTRHYQFAVVRGGTRFPAKSNHDECKRQAAPHSALPRSPTCRRISATGYVMFAEMKECCGRGLSRRHGHFRS